MTLSLTTHADQIAHYKAVKHRINNAKFRPRPVVANDDEPKPIMAKQLPAWECMDMYFDDHVRRYNARHLPKYWLKNRCKQLGVDYNHVIGPRRGRDIIYYRFQLIWEMSNIYALSLPQLGKIFGDRDHTSILNALRKWEKINGHDRKNRQSFG